MREFKNKKIYHDWQVAQQDVWKNVEPPDRSKNVWYPKWGPKLFVPP